MIKQESQRGFTLVEIIVATALFVLTVSLIMGLFTYTLKVNRKVQSIRTAVQGTRNFVETLAREIRNGRVYYKSSGSTGNICGAEVNSNYNSNKTGLAITTATGDLLCFYLERETSSSTKGRLYVKKYDNSSSSDPQEITSNTFWVNYDTFRLEVNPSSPPTSSKTEQPRVTLFAEFISQISGTDDRITIPYQTTISTDVYDIPAKTP